MLNKVMLIGRLGQDPELRYTKGGGVPVTTLSVATDETYVDRDGNKQKTTEWHRVVVFQRQAENCSTYLGKGSLVYVEGSLTTRKWQDQNGQDRYTTEIRARSVQFLDRKGERYGDGPGAEDGDRYGGYQNRPPKQNPQWNQQPDYGPGGGESGGGQRPREQWNERPRQPEEDLGPAFASQVSSPAYPSEGAGQDIVPF